MKFLIYLTMLTFSYQAFSQDKPGKISGTISDSAQKPIEAATVELLVPKTQALVKMSVTDKDGRFEIEKIGEGEYVLSVTAVGFTKKTSTVQITAAKPQVQLSAFVLEHNADALKEVVVTQKKPLVEN